MAHVHRGAARARAQNEGGERGRGGRAARLKGHVFVGDAICDGGVVPKQAGAELLRRRSPGPRVSPHATTGRARCGGAHRDAREAGGVLAAEGHEEGVELVELPEERVLLLPGRREERSVSEALPGAGAGPPAPESLRRRYVCEKAQPRACVSFAEMQVPPSRKHRSRVGRACGRRAAERAGALSCRGQEERRHHNRHGRLYPRHREVAGLQGEVRQLGHHVVLHGEHLLGGGVSAGDCNSAGAGRLRGGPRRAGGRGAEARTKNAESAGWGAGGLDTIAPAAAPASAARCCPPGCVPAGRSRS